MSRTVRVHLHLYADVTVTDDVKRGMAEQYSYTPAELANDELCGRAMLYASINPRIPYDNELFDDYWDGVANMRGLINNIELVDERD